MKVLVTGASGFIGGHLVRRLAARPGFEVTALVRAPRRFPRPIKTAVVDGGGERLDAILRKSKPDVVVHLASLFLSAHAPEQVEPLIRANILFGTRLLEAMTANGVSRLVNTGTSWEHMDGAREYRPVCLYAATKRAFEDILAFYEDAKGLRAVTLKLFDTYGPNDARPKLFAAFKKAMSAPEPVPFSPGGQTLDLCHVDDVVRAYEKAIAHVVRKKDARHENIPIGLGAGTPLREVASLFEECAGGRLNIAWGARPYREREVMRSAADLRPAREVLGWQPRLDLKSGLKSMVKRDRLSTAS